MYNVALRLASRLRLTLVHVPLLSHKFHGDHAELRGKEAALEAMLGVICLHLPWPWPWVPLAPTSARSEEPTEPTAGQLPPA